MPKLKLVFITFLIALTAIGNCIAETFEDVCRNSLPKAKITVHTAQSLVKFDYTKSIRELTRMRNYHKGKVVLGSTYTSIQMSVKWKFNSLKGQGNRGCTRASGDVFMTVNPQTVYIGKEFPFKTCAFNEIYRHEMRHAYTNQEHMERVADYYQKLMTEAFGQKIFYGEFNQLQIQLNNEFKTQWMPQITEDLKMVSVLHSQIDTPEEYARNEVMCNGIVPEIISEMGF